MSCELRVILKTLVASCELHIKCELRVTFVIKVASWKSENASCLKVASCQDLRRLWYVAVAVVIFHVFGLPNGRRCCDVSADARLEKR